MTAHKTLQINIWNFPFIYLAVQSGILYSQTIKVKESKAKVNFISIIWGSVTKILKWLQVLVKNMMFYVKLIITASMKFKWWSFLKTRILSQFDITNISTNSVMNGDLLTI